MYQSFEVRNNSFSSSNYCCFDLVDVQSRVSNLLHAQSLLSKNFTYKKIIRQMSLFVQFIIMQIYKSMIIMQLLQKLVSLLCKYINLQKYKEKNPSMQTKQVLKLHVNKISQSTYFLKFLEYIQYEILLLLRINHLSLRLYCSSLGVKNFI